MTEVKCPVDGCEYQDAVRSVKAHITASTDDDHDGMHGMDAADSLREQANSRLNGELPRLDDAVDEARDAVANAAGGILTRPGTGPDDPAEPAQAATGPEPGEEPDDASPEPDDEPAVEPVDEIETDDTDDGGGFGIPIPVQSSTVIVAALGLVVVAVIYSRGSGSGSDDSDQPDDDAPTDDVVQSGLVR